MKKAILSVSYGTTDPAQRACTIGRVIMPPGEVPVSIIISFIGAPFFLYLITRERKI